MTGCYKIELPVQAYKSIFVPFTQDIQLTFPSKLIGDKVEIYIEKRSIATFMHKMLIRKIDEFEVIQSALAKINKEE